MKKYKATFNWYGETLVLYTSAKSDKQAYHNCISRIAEICNKPRSIINIYFRKDVPNYHIKEVLNEAQI